MSPVTLSRIVNYSNLACFVTGLVFAFLGGTISTVGVALLVGALFSEGAFMGQLWTITVQNRYIAFDRLWGGESFTRMEQLKEKVTDLSERVDKTPTTGGRARY